MTSITRGPRTGALWGAVAAATLTLTAAAGAAETAPSSDIATTAAADSLEAEAAFNVAIADPVLSEEDGETWMQRVDRFFGNYLVAPLEAVLFYDFGSRHWLGTRVPLVVVWLFSGAIFFTLRMGLINLRAFRHAVWLTAGRYDDPRETGEVSHFQALASALSATVGLGNIAGVAIAVGTGGPGAIFWLVVAGLLGMTSKFTECTLGMMYRRVEPDGRVSGGPMHYLRDGLAELGLAPLGGVLAVLFTVMCIGASFGGGCAFQVAQSLGAVRQQLPLLEQMPWIYGLVMALLAGLVILGGIRRIASTAEKIVPLMCGVYVLACIYVIATHYDRLPAALEAILAGAFTGQGVQGGAIGVMVIGIRRAAFSNEAGVGSAAIAHSAARTNEPVREGIVALLEPFIDTVVVCTMTGLVIVVTGVYDRSIPEYETFIAADRGAELTSLAFGSVVSWFPKLLALTVFLFAYSTVISWSYYGERCFSRLFGSRWSLVYKLTFLGFVLLGSIVTEGNVLTFSDLMILSMAFPNVLGAVLLSGKVRRRLDAYWSDYRAGKFERGGAAARGP